MFKGFHVGFFYNWSGIYTRWQTSKYLENMYKRYHFSSISHHKWKRFPFNFNKIIIRNTRTDPISNPLRPLSLAQNPKESFSLIILLSFSGSSKSFSLKNHSLILVQNLSLAASFQNAQKFNNAQKSNNEPKPPCIQPETTVYSTSILSFVDWRSNT
jgi:hypothetical protein